MALNKPTTKAAAYYNDNVPARLRLSSVHENAVSVARPTFAWPARASSNEAGCSRPALALSAEIITSRRNHLHHVAYVDKFRPPQAARPRENSLLSMYVDGTSKIVQYEAHNRNGVSSKLSC